jgi:hypothetical protein
MLKRLRDLTVILNVSLASLFSSAAHTAEQSQVQFTYYVTVNADTGLRELNVVYSDPSNPTWIYLYTKNLDQDQASGQVMTPPPPSSIPGQTYLATIALPNNGQVLNRVELMNMAQKKLQTWLDQIRYSASRDSQLASLGSANPAGSSLAIESILWAQDPALHDALDHESLTDLGITQEEMDLLYRYQIITTAVSPTMSSYMTRIVGQRIRILAGHPLESVVNKLQARRQAAMNDSMQRMQTSWTQQKQGLSGQP